MKTINKLRTLLLLVVVGLGLTVYASTTDFSINKEDLSAYSRWNMSKTINHLNENY